MLDSYLTNDANIVGKGHKIEAEKEPRNYEKYTKTDQKTMQKHMSNKY